ncbi:MAG: rod shape-determining protein MreD [Coriobacteriales bacterium]|jgi:rod shape-determining protein MreD|nr:rod shape-determining protein MreD [Coriobacteriales bacterium]
MNTDAPSAPPLFTAVGALVAFLLQLMLAPNIAILDAVPNFILGFVILNAMRCNTVRSTLLGFLLGLLYDLMAQGPLGILSFVGALVGYSTSSLGRDLVSQAWPVRAFALLLAAFVGELLHAALLALLGYDPDFLLSLGMRVVPGALYLGVFGLVTFLLMHLVEERSRKNPGALKGKFD